MLDGQGDVVVIHTKIDFVLALNHKRKRRWSCFFHFWHEISKVVVSDYEDQIWLQFVFEDWNDTHKHGYATCASGMESTDNQQNREMTRRFTWSKSNVTSQNCFLSLKKKDTPVASTVAYWHCYDDCIGIHWRRDKHGAAYVIPVSHPNTAWSCTTNWSDT